MDLTPQSVLFQTSVISVLNLIIQELDPKSVCLSLNISSSKTELLLPELNFEVPSVVMNCDHFSFLQVFKEGIGLGCSVSSFNHTFNRCSSLTS